MATFRPIVVAGIVSTVTMLGLAVPAFGDVDVTFDDRVLYLNGRVDSEEYFGDSFASPTGEFVMPEFNSGVGDCAFGFESSYACSSASIDCLIDLVPAGAATFSGNGSSSADGLLDFLDAFEVNGFGSSEFDVNISVADTDHLFEFSGTINASGDARARAGLFDGPTIFDPPVFDVATDAEGSGLYEFGGVLPPGEYRIDIFATASRTLFSEGSFVGNADFNFTLTLTPAPDCPGDINGDLTVDTDDFLAVLGAWGACPAPCPPICMADTNNDCVVDTDDFLAVLDGWGSCVAP